MCAKILFQSYTLLIIKDWLERVLYLGKESLVLVWVSH